MIVGSKVVLGGLVGLALGVALGLWAGGRFGSPRFTPVPESKWLYFDNKTGQTCDPRQNAADWEKAKAERNVADRALQESDKKPTNLFAQFDDKAALPPVNATPYCKDLLKAW
jgi:hypothetical protein